ncbi:hypothetical protein FA13DRAFT_1851954 [Coprinellus micaceus]|uniref:Uncharacterized protein n=1 Tax=Coprinellus micaceus TaxID=71717 RepID=A0A4Y7TAP6_COPMI|nr:hypothetical protein FA13DRAFT_1851954 [Coprinellus micaceus]
MVVRGRGVGATKGKQSNIILSTGCWWMNQGFKYRSSEYCNEVSREWREGTIEGEKLVGREEKPRGGRASAVDKSCGVQFRSPRSMFSGVFILRLVADGRRIGESKGRYPDAQGHLGPAGTTKSALQNQKDATTDLLLSAFYRSGRMASPPRIMVVFAEICAGTGQHILFPTTRFGWLFTRQDVMTKFKELRPRGSRARHAAKVIAVECGVRSSSRFKGRFHTQSAGYEKQPKIHDSRVEASVAEEYSESLEESCLLRIGPIVVWVVCSFYHSLISQLKSKPEATFPG